MKKQLLITILAVVVLLPQVQGRDDVTSPGDPVIGGQMIGGVFTPATPGTPAGNANMFPVNAPPSAAIDNSLDSKYRNFGEVFTGFVVTPTFGGSNGGGRS